LQHRARAQRLQEIGVGERDVEGNRDLDLVRGRRVGDDFQALGLNASSWAWV
jgi:hypothetical protein